VIGSAVSLGKCEEEDQGVYPRGLDIEVLRLAIW